jgi:hypothetical protein
MAVRLLRKLAEEAAVEDAAVATEAVKVEVAEN